MDYITFGNLLYISRAYQNYRRIRTPEASLSPADLLLISYIYRNEGCIQDQLVKHTGMDKTTIAHRINRLEESGYVIRNISETDARSKQCHLTEKAIRIYPEIHRQHLEFRQGVLAGLTEEELAVLDRLTSQMKKNAEQLITETAPREHEKRSRGDTGPRLRAVPREHGKRDKK